MRLMDLVLYQVERYGVMRFHDAAKNALNAAIAEVTAPEYVPDAEARTIATRYRNRRAQRRCRAKRRQAA